MMNYLSISEAVRIIASKVEAPELFPGSKGTPFQDHFIARLGIKMSELVEARSKNGMVHDSEIADLVKESVQMFEQEREKMNRG